MPCGGLPAFRVSAKSFWINVPAGRLFTSRSAVEWSTGGLENPLSNVLIALMCCVILRGGLDRASLFLLCFCGGLLVLNRLDSVFLAGPLVLCVIWQHLRLGDWRSCARAFALFAAPTLLWMAGAAFYYGFPLPNTAYAKIAGESAVDRARQGLWYLIDFARHEPFHGLVLIIAPVLFVAAGLRSKSCRWRLWSIAAGSALGLAYVVAVGGDYMRGRFVTGPFTWIRGLSCCTSVDSA